MNKYVKQYEWSNIFAMIRNLKSETAVCADDFHGRLVVITGATSGIGTITAEKYASHGADILTINRNEQKSQALCEKLTATYNVNCDYIIADFSRLADIHAAGKQLSEMDRAIDVFIHNAGVYMTKKSLTEDTIEHVFQTNYLSTFILNNYIKEKLFKQKQGRILFVNSEAHRFAVWGLNLDDLNWEKHRYSGAKGYGAAKMAQLLSMIKLAEYFTGTGVTVNAMHPGNVKTQSGQNNGPIYKFLKRILIDSTAEPIEISAEALYYLGVSGEVKDKTGKFFNLTTEEEPAPPALDKEEAEALWQISQKLGNV